MSVYASICLMVVLLNGFIAKENGTERVTQCNKADNEIIFNECLRSRIQRAIHDSGNDNTESELASVDPLIVNTINMGHNVIKMKLRGISNTTVVSFMINIDKCRIYAETNTPLLKSEGEFVSPSGTYVLPIDDDTMKNSTIENVRVVHLMECEKYNIDGSEFLRITKYNILLKPDTALLKLNKLLDGFVEAKKDYRLDSKTTKYIKNSAITIGKRYGIILSNVANKRLEKLPLNLLFN